VKTVSIGFIPKQRSSNDRTIITKSEMLEFSFVAVPANPEALSLDGKIYQKCLDL
jgi:phage head maturation protease